jgi:dihydrolipoamide dehydrogenase
MKLAILGGGPAGHSAATVAARLGADVTVVERDVIGGAAHLWDCIPSKAMIATGGARSFLNRAADMGLAPAPASIDLDGLRQRIVEIKDHLERSVTELLTSQSVRIIRGTGVLNGAHELTATTVEGLVEPVSFDKLVVCTGSRPRIPDWAEPDGVRVLTTRQAYPPPELPEHIVIIGSGVTGVEFAHLFSSLGSDVTLVVSRQQVLPNKDPEVAAALEDEFLRRGITLLKGARAVGIDRSADGVTVRCDDGRAVVASHALLAIGSIPNSDGIGLDVAGVTVDNGYLPIDRHCVTNVSHIYAAGDVSGKLPLSSVATMQGRKIAEHAMGLHALEHRHLDYDKAASAIFTEPEIAEVGVAEAEAFSSGRKIRVTKVPFSVSAKAMINGDTRGFVKIISDPATGVILGGSIVGRHAAELISVIALAVTAGLRVSDIVDSLLVHPALAEVLAEAAE